MRQLILFTPTGVHAAGIAGWSKATQSQLGAAADGNIEGMPHCTVLDY